MYSILPITTFLASTACDGAEDWEHCMRVLEFYVWHKDTSSLDKSADLHSTHCPTAPLLLLVLLNRRLPLQHPRLLFFFFFLRNLLSIPAWRSEVSSAGNNPVGLERKKCCILSIRIHKNSSEGAICHEPLTPSFHYKVSKFIDFSSYMSF